VPAALAFVTALMLGGATPVAAGTDSLDQAQTLNLSFQRLSLMAQSFTAGQTGQVDRVSLMSDTSFGFTNATIQIQSVTAAGAPSGTVLGTSTFQGTLQCCSQFHDFAFSPAVPVSAGTKYAIVVHVIVGKLTWYDSWAINAYAGGQLYVGCNGCAWLTGSSFGQDFAFKTWVATNVNQAPVAAADHPAVTAAEGTAPSNTGTYSDPDGDTVALSASSGSLTRTGTASGTWSWTQPPSDEAPTQTVTITADDGHGLSSTTGFTVTVAATAPSTEITIDPVSSPEGTPVGLAGLATSADAADNTAGFTYGWSVTKNGNAFSTGSGTSFTFTPDDEGTFVVTLHATDDGGMTGAASQTIIGTNVAPSAKIGSVSASAPLVVTSQETLTFAGSFTDPGKLDSHVVTWTFGDGASSTASYGPGGDAGFSATHAYGAAGTYTARLTVTDDDGGVATATTQVVVQTPQQAMSKIAAYVSSLATLTGGQKDSLIAKLNAASASAARGDAATAHNQLNAFLNELRADTSTGKVSSADAATLNAAVHAVQAALGNFNRFLEWWPLEA
jgi:hypothetical protein